MFAYCKERGLVDADFDAALFNHQSPASCFCRIPKDRFRARVAEVEAMLDRRRAAARRSKILRIPRKLWRLRELGFVGSLKRGVRSVLGP
jgi:hypothetical protein